MVLICEVLNARNFTANHLYVYAYRTSATRGVYELKLDYFSFDYVQQPIYIHLQAFFSLCSAAILRRHLMVWKIFAPAFIYEGASFIFTCIVCLVSYLLFIRLSRSVRRYIKNFDLQHMDQGIMALVQLSVFFLHSSLIMSCYLISFLLLDLFLHVYVI